MIKVKRYKGSNRRIWPLLSSSWVPVTLSFLLFYTSGITCTGESSSDSSSHNNNDTVPKNYTLTGNPQIDYVHDPNLPRELNGYNLSDYPFYNKVPSNINFSCDGLKDGFYASAVHKCQLYHHCLFGTRYDFLCANYTAFDQKTFICQFVSVVDCPNSHLYFHRNKELYVTKTTTPPPRPSRRPGLYDRRRPPPRTSNHGSGDRSNSGNEQSSQAETHPTRKPESSSSGTDATPAPVEDDYRDPGGDVDYESEEDYRPARRKPQRRRCKNKRRCRAWRRRRPRPRPAYYDYYEEDYEDYYDDEYYDERPVKRRKNKDTVKGGNKVAGSKAVETTEKVTSSTSTTIKPEDEQLPLELEMEALAKTRDELLFTKTRPAPKVRPPVPRNVGQGRSVTSPSTTTTTTSTPPPPQSQEPLGDEYYYDEDVPPNQNQAPETPRPTQPTTTTLSPRQKFLNRHHFRPSSSTTASTTTAAPTTTPTTTTPRPVQKHIVTSRPYHTTSTTTATEEPTYEYEYEYEDEVSPSPHYPVSSQRPTLPSTTPATTPRTTPRGKRPPITAIQTSTSVSIQEVSSDQDEVIDDSQNAINRRQSAWLRGGGGQQGLQGPKSTEISVVANPTIPSSLERQRGPSRQEPVITVKAYVPSTPSSPSTTHPTIKTTEASIIKQRPSRFWQRPAKVVASTTTSESPVAIAQDYSESDYSDEPELPQPPPSNPLRYNNGPTAPSPQFPSAPSRLKTTPALSPASSTSATYPNAYQQAYREQFTSSVSSTPSPHQSQQYLRPTQTQNSFPPLPPPPRLQQPQQNFVSQFGPSPSSMGIQYQHHLPPSSPTSSSRPEFISLLRDDEDPSYYEQQHGFMHHGRNPSHGHNSYTNTGRRLPPVPVQRPQYYGPPGPQQQFHQTQKTLFPAAQETHLSLVPAPSKYNFLGLRDFGPSGAALLVYARRELEDGGNRHLDNIAVLSGNK